MTSKAEAVQGCIHGTGGNRQTAATKAVSLTALCLGEANRVRIFYAHKNVCRGRRYSGFYGRRCYGHD